MRLLRSLMPVAVLALLTLVAVLPWDLRAEHRFFLPLVPFAAIHYWIQRGGEGLSLSIAFACGLALDILTQGPLGFWSLIYVAGTLLARATTFAVGDRALSRWASFAVITAALAALCWTVASLYSGRAAGWSPFAFAAAATTLTYPLVALLCAPLVAGFRPGPGERATQGR